jgi:rhodanese-related sulfurtransferase
LPTPFRRRYRPHRDGRAKCHETYRSQNPARLDFRRPGTGLIDAREDGEFGADHLFWAVPFGMAHRETRAHTLLPRKSVRICVTDDGSRLAPNLATWLEAANGYTDVSVLAGGTKAWKDAGYVISAA